MKLVDVAEHPLRLAGSEALAETLKQQGFETDSPVFFDTIRVKAPGAAAQIAGRARRPVHVLLASELVERASA